MIGQSVFCEREHKGDVIKHVCLRKRERERESELKIQDTEKLEGARSVKQFVCVTPFVSALQLCSTTPLSKQRYLLPKHTPGRPAAASLIDWTAVGQRRKLSLDR